MSVLPAEARLLLLATRPPAFRDEAALVELANSPLNWAAVGELAEREKLLPVLWSHLKQHANAIPPEIAGALQRQAVVTEFRMAMTESVLERAVAELAAEGIPVMLLKDAALATTVYPSFAQRPMGDLDILVRPEHAQRAWQRMKDSGWTLEPESAGNADFHESHHHLPPLIDPRGLKVVLEIHRAMLPIESPCVLDPAEVWRDARRVSLGGTTAWVPSDIHQLLHLSIHFAWSHMLEGGVARTVRDVATLIGTGTMEWPEFAALATRTRAATCAYWTLAMTKTLGGAAVPDAVMEVLRPRQSIAVTHALERAYIMSGLARACPSVRVAQLMWSAGVRPGASGHGRARPWHTCERFKEAFHVGRIPTLAARVGAHLRGIAAWYRFATLLGIPRRVI
jgi:hypothetical protein